MNLEVWESNEATPKIYIKKDQNLPTWETAVDASFSVLALKSKIWRDKAPSDRLPAILNIFVYENRQIIER
jgi:hypothetical protein